MRTTIKIECQSGRDIDVKLQQTWAQSANPGCIMQAHFPRSNHIQRSCLTSYHDTAVPPGKSSALPTPLERPQLFLHLPQRLKYSHYFKSTTELYIAISPRIIRTHIFLILTRFLKNQSDIKFTYNNMHLFQILTGVCTMKPYSNEHIVYSFHLYYHKSPWYPFLIIQVTTDLISTARDYFSPF